VAVKAGAAIGLDRFIRDDVHHAAAPDVTIAAEAFSTLGSFAVIALLAAATAAILFARRNRARALYVLFVLAGAVVLNNGLKYSFQRPRPQAFFGLDPASFSFPSGHALYSVSFYLGAGIMLAGEARPLPLKYAVTTAAMTLVVAIGLSRVYLGVHYPTDVMAGFAIGGCWLCMSGEIFRFLIRRG
jgi:undecaprenyl-diphosphatase